MLFEKLAFVMRLEPWYIAILGSAKVQNFYTFRSGTGKATITLLFLNCKE